MTKQSMLKLIDEVADERNQAGMLLDDDFEVLADAIIKRFRKPRLNQREFKKLVKMVKKS